MKFLYNNLAWCVFMLIGLGTYIASWLAAGAAAWALFGVSVLAWSYLGMRKNRASQPA
jgi:ABC-type uncharacterized transport system permease subunit